MLSTRIWLQIKTVRKILSSRNCDLLRTQSNKYYYTFMNAEKFRNQFINYSGGSIDLTKDEETGIAVLIINNPEKKNAFTGQMMVELESKISELELWTSGKALILHGTANTFCSGADLNTINKLVHSEDGNNMCLWMQDTLFRLYNLPLISVALVEGKALGGGAELCTACDFRLMTEDAVIQFVQVRMGLVPGWGGGSRLANLVGPTIALQCLASAKPISAQNAKSIGLVNDIVPPKSDTINATHNWLKTYTNGAPEVLHALKNIITHSRTLSLSDSLHKERQEFNKVLGQPANMAAISLNIKHN